jgi:hypothetical protein
MRLLLLYRLLQCESGRKVKLAAFFVARFTVSNHAERPARNSVEGFGDEAPDSSTKPSTTPNLAGLKV